MLGISLWEMFDIYVRGVFKNRLIAKASAISWSFFLSLFPFLLFLLSILPFLNDFLSLSKTFFIDSLSNISGKLNVPDRISLLDKITSNLSNFSKQLASLDLEKIKSHSDGYTYIDITHEEIKKERKFNTSNSIVLNDSIRFKEKEYQTDNEIFRNWLKNPDLMQFALNFNSANPILDPFHDSFEKIIPKEDRYKHSYITGKTGSGKSELLKTLIYRDILNEDCSVILLDIHGDLAKDVARLVKDKERLVLIDPILEKDFTPTINLFDTDDKSEENIEQVSQMISSVINSISIDDKLSGTMIDILENCIPVLIRDKNRDFYDLKSFMKVVNKEKLPEKPLANIPIKEPAIPTTVFIIPPILENKLVVFSFTFSLCSISNFLSIFPKVSEITF
jgi:hypothetical protein